jgi:hypothetical protein
MMRGYVKATLVGADLSIEGENTIVAAGDALMAAMIASSTGVRVASIALASTDTPTTSGMTGMQSAAHAYATLALATAVGAAVTYRATVSNLSAAAYVAEYGLFTATTATGGMLARFLGSPFTLATGDTLQIDWTMTIG